MSREDARNTTPTPRPSPPEMGDALAFSDFRRVGTASIYAIAGALLLSLLYAWPVAGARATGPIIWELALLIGGACIGFLFGIPKVLQVAKAAEREAASRIGDELAGARAAIAYQQRVNTNLEEISDWLTKIIVGVGLIQLKDVPTYLDKLAQAIASSFGGVTEDHKSVALAISLLFPTMGFIVGFLATRLYIQGALARADVRAGREGVGSDAVDLKIQNLEVRMDTLTRSRTMPEIAPASEGGPESGGLDVDEKLRGLAREYLAVKDSDWTLRVAKKNSLAAQMHKYSIDHGISRDRILEEARARLPEEQAHPDAEDRYAEGLVMALATCAQAVPQPEDTERLLSVSGMVTRKHVQYRIVLAFTNLFEQGLVSPRQRSRIITILDSYLPRADASLRSLLDRALRVFRGDVGSTFAAELR
jgi:hypothetical protein